MKKVLLLALALSNVHVVRADEIPEEPSYAKASADMQGDYEILTKIGAAVVALGAVGAVLYASRGDVVGALRSVTADIPKPLADLPKPGFSKKALAFTGIVGFGAGLIATATAGAWLVWKLVTIPGDMQLLGNASASEKLGHPEHSDMMANFAYYLMQVSDQDSEAGKFARFMMAHMNFIYSPLAKCSYGPLSKPPPHDGQLVKHSSGPRAPDGGPLLLLE